MKRHIQIPPNMCLNCHMPFALGLIYPLIPVCIAQCGKTNVTLFVTALFLCNCHVHIVVIEFQTRGSDVGEVINLCVEHLLFCE